MAENEKNLNTGTGEPSKPEGKRKRPRRLGLLLGLLGCCGIMLFISMMAGMKAVTG